MRTARVVAAAFTTVLLGVTMATPAGADDRSAFASVRQATAAYHSTAAAEAAGYEEFLPCFDSPGVGGSGQHFADLSAIDGTIEARHPEALVYEPGNRYRLVALEYIVPQAAWTGAAAPRLFGRSFERDDTLGIWALHLWIWQANPLGMFADYNPNVRLCP